MKAKEVSTGVTVNKKETQGLTPMHYKAETKPSKEYLKSVASFSCLNVATCEWTKIFMTRFSW